MYGTLAAGGTYGEGYSFLGRPMSPQVRSRRLHSLVAPAWTFYPTPSSLQTGVVAWGSDTTNCAQCSVARMFTLAQNSPGDDGSCFGWCNGAPNGRWTGRRVDDVHASVGRFLRDAAARNRTTRSDSASFPVASYAMRSLAPCGARAGARAPALFPGCCRKAAHATVRNESNDRRCDRQRRSFHDFDFPKH